MSTPKDEPTPGLRVEGRLEMDLDNDKEIAVFLMAGTPKVSARQCAIDTAHINELLERDEQVRKRIQPPKENDVFVDMGDLSDKLPTMFDGSKEFEDQVFDYIDTFNHAVIQGVPVVHALQAFTKALSITLVACVSANMHPGIALTFLEAARLAVHGARSRLRVITSNN